MFARFMDTARMHAAYISCRNILLNDTQLARYPTKLSLILSKSTLFYHRVSFADQVHAKCRVKKSKVFCFQN